MIGIGVRLRHRLGPGIAPHLRHANRLDVGVQRHAPAGFVAHDLRPADGPLCRRASAVRRWRVLVIGVRRRATVAERAHEVRELAAGRVEVEVAHVGLARVAKAVDDIRRHARQRAGRHSDGLALDAEPERQLAVENVEEVGVVMVDVQVGAVATCGEARPRRVQPGVVGEDLDAPVGRVADDLAAAGRDDDWLDQRYPVASGGRPASWTSTM